MSGLNLRGAGVDSPGASQGTNGHGLTVFARHVIEAAVRAGDLHRVPVPRIPEAAFGGVFVTLRKLGRLRGCMGCLDDSVGLFEAVRLAAVDAALNDPRFAPVAAGELANIRLDVSVMSVPERVAEPLTALEVGRHGILVRRNGSRGLFLPQVAMDHGFDAAEFLARCCSEKAGMDRDAWKHPETEVCLFTTTVYSE